MNNGEGLRVVLWLSGCSHHCKGCQNPQTWDKNSGIEFDISAKNEIFEELSKDYISGITFSGGDPLHESNVNGVLNLVQEIRERFPNKTIWLYTGYTVNIYEQYNCDHTIIETLPRSKNIEDDFKRVDIIRKCDVLVDGRYEDLLKDVSLHWCGSSNQRVIDVKESIKQGEVILYD